MSAKHPLIDPMQVGMSKLQELAVEFERDGVTAEKARLSLVEDSFLLGRRLSLRVHAFKPTGVALGYPLPTPRLQSSFSALCDRAEEYLRRLCGLTGPVLSRVPPNAYHITLVNRTHFDVQKDKRKVRCLSLAEKQQVERIVGDHCCRSLAVRYRGLLATKSGRLMVPAYPEDARVFWLKEALRDGVLGGPRQKPVLDVNYPVHTFTKLGHIVVGLDGVLLRRFVNWMREEGTNVDASIEFADTYTQLGRISL